MTGLAIAIAVMVSSAEGVPAHRVEKPPLIEQAIALELAPNVTTVPVAPRGTTAMRKASTVEKIFAIAGGAAVGWLGGSAIGYAVTSKSNDADDVSGLRGVVIGAPIGAIIGGFVGYYLVK